MERGHKKQAEEAFDFALATYPSSASAWFNRSDLVKFTVDDPSVARMENELGALKGRESINHMLLHFALGKAYLDIGDGEKAFGHLNAANRFKRSTLKYDADATNRWMGRIAEVFSEEKISALAVAGAASHRPVFIVGLPRSGTTLLEQILSSHRDVQAAGELRFVQQIVDQLGGRYPDNISGLVPANVLAAGNEYLRRIELLAAGKSHVTDKMPGNFLFVGLIRMILPEARIIHARREPADTLLSCYSRLFASDQPFAYDQTELGKFYRGYASLMEHWKKIIPEANFIEVQYEDVVADAEGQARRLLTFLGLDWDPQCLEFHRSERVIRTASVNQVRQPLYSTSSGRWKKYEPFLAEMLEAIGGGTARAS
jgi:tetratricopeptide (TPR) repeat protein